MKLPAILSAITALAACSHAFDPPAVADYSSESVTIRSSMGLDQDPSIATEAARLCGMNGRTAEYAATSRSSTLDHQATMVMGVPVFGYEYLFVCKEAA